MDQNRQKFFQKCTCKFVHNPGNQWQKNKQVFDVSWINWPNFSHQNLWQLRYFSVNFQLWFHKLQWVRLIIRGNSMLCLVFGYLSEKKRLFRNSIGHKFRSNSRDIKWTQNQKFFLLLNWTKTDKQNRKLFSL